MKCNPRPCHQQPLPDPGTTPAGLDALYLHVPFCFHKCHYCDFYSLVEPDGRAGERHGPFTDALIRELRYRLMGAGVRPRTVFVGGGTPTLLDPGCWERLLAALEELGVTPGPAEFTVEANPETVTPALMRTLAAGGVTRVSIGAQSFQPPLLKALERWHDPSSVGRAVAAVRTAGITQLNLDLIFGVPGQNLADLDADLDAALALEPTHLACYGLTYEPHTALRQKLDLGRVTPIDPDLEARMYQRVLDRLAVAGFEQYEVSNFARPGARCLHNLVYWENGNWLGFGPAAASHIDGLRWKNLPNLTRYLAESPTPPTTEHERLDADRRLGERLMLGLRLRAGVAWPVFDAELAPGDPRRAAIERYTEAGLLEHAGDHLRFTRAGLLVADSVLAELL